MSNINNRKLGSAVREIRKLRRLTQAELAEAADMSSNNLAILERGERGFTLKSINRLAKALDLPAPCLVVLGTDAPNRKDTAAVQLLEALQRLVRSLVTTEEAWGIKPRRKRVARRRKLLSR